MRVLAVLYFRIVAAVAIAMLASGVRPVPASADSPAQADPDPDRFAAEIQAFEETDHKTPPPRDAILFVGSSSIRLWPTAKSFPELSLINRGFGGSQISDVNHFADRIVLPYRPRVIVFYAGDNDIADGKRPAQVFEDFQEFLVLVHRELPESRILYLPIKPSVARWKLWPEMREVNAQVEALAKHNARLEYIDTATPMLGENAQPRPELFVEDGLHMNAAGYEVWVNVLKPVLSDVR